MKEKLQSMSVGELLSLREAITTELDSRRTKLVGAKVRHKKNHRWGVGTVKDVSRSGERAYVQFGEAWPAYYRIDPLDVVSEP